MYQQRQNPHYNQQQFPFNQNEIRPNYSPKQQHQIQQNPAYINNQNDIHQQQQQKQHQNNPNPAVPRNQNEMRPNYPAKQQQQHQIGQNDIHHQQQQYQYKNN